MPKSFRIEALTVRGLGSYLVGHRLELGELTILCGTNGSGKSTWIRLLDILKASASQDGVLPYELVDDLAPNQPDLRPWHGLTTSILNETDMGNPTEAWGLNLDEECQEREFGPWCTVGLELRAENEDLNLTPMTDPPERELLSAGGRLVWWGECSKGTKVTLRFTCPTHETDGNVYAQGFSIHIGETGDEYVDFRTAPTKSSEDRPADTGYAVTCSPELLPGSVLRNPVCRVFPRDATGSRRVLEVGAGADRAVDLVDAVEQRVVELIRAALSGYFHVSDIRERHRLVEVPADQFKDDEVVRTRDVGRNGERTHLLERRYAMAHMKHWRGAETPKSYVFDVFYSEWLKQLLDIQVKLCPTTIAGEVSNRPGPWTIESRPSGCLTLFPFP
jgi:energy-coupling factor transporter ATP-binding protein EcfA2